MQLPEKRTTLLASVILVLAITVAYVPSLVQSQFVTLDDTLLITENSTIQELTMRSVFKAFTSYDPELYVPLTLVSYQIEHSVAGLNPVVFHFTNLVLHAASTVLLFLLATLLLKSRNAGFVVALLFALHPLHTEAVAWAAARKDVLSTFFFLLTLYLYERSERFSETYLKKWSVLTFLCALLSKVTVLPLPLLLPLLALMRGEKLTREKLTCYWPYWALSLMFAVIAYIGKTRNLGSLTPVDYLLIGSKSTVFYLSKMFWPVDFSVSYHQVNPVTITSPEFFLPVLMVMALVCVMLYLFYRQKFFAASCMLFFFFTVSVNFFNVWKNGMLFFASDRYAYIPSIGIFLLIGLAIRKLPRTGEIAAAVVCALVLLPLAFFQSKVWISSESLYTHALAVSPTSVMVLNNLGDYYVDNDQESRGLELFIKAVDSDPKNIVALTNIGNLYKKNGDLVKAEEYYRKASEVVPKDPFPEHLMGLYLLGELQIETGKVDDGLESLAQAVRLGSKYAEPYFNFGLMLEKQGRKQEAIEVYAKGVETNGDYLIARYHLASLLAEQGKLPEAIEQLEAIVKRNPGYEKAAEHLANMKNMVGSE